MTDKHADIRERYFGKVIPGHYIEDRTIKEDIRRLLDEVERLDDQNQRNIDYAMNVMGKENERLRKALDKAIYEIRTAKHINMQARLLSTLDALEESE